MIPSILSMTVHGESTSYGTLGRLPLELRNEIYTLVLGKCWNLIHPKPEEISQDLGIMATSKSISLEAQEVFYAKSIFFVRAGKLRDNNDATLPNDRFIHAPRIRCLELRHSVWESEAWSTADLYCDREYQNVSLYLGSLLDRGPVDQEFRLRLYSSYDTHKNTPPYYAMFGEMVSSYKTLCLLNSVTVEWLHVVYDEALEEVTRVEMCPYFQELNSQLESFLGPSRMDKGHVKRCPCSAILRFSPRQHRSKLYESPQ